MVDDENTPLNEYFDDNGFSSKVSLKNLGSTTIYIGILLLALLLIPPLNLCKSRHK